MSGTQVCRGKLLNLIITLVMVLFMVCSQGSCATAELCGIRSADRDVGITCQEDDINAGKATGDKPVAEVNDLKKG